MSRVRGVMRLADVVGVDGAAAVGVRRASG